MSDDLDFELDNIEDDKKIERIRTLSDKVKTTSLERDEMAQAKATAEAKAQEVEKDLNFYKTFNQVSSKYQGATEYQDKILEKVRGGYDVEDATVAVLNKEGKFNPSAPAKDSPAGGSAANQITDGGTKSLSDMTAEERAAAMRQAEAQGDIRFD